mmetsp:Transcript_7840/g.21366  ORF Transcript_7840/g.21366 Transcript_7840/m.21366 type:complete len:87 (+) Transcript_7840:3778-4038(+)
MVARHSTTLNSSSSRSNGEKREWLTVMMPSLRVAVLCRRGSALGYREVGHLVLGADAGSCSGLKRASEDLRPGRRVVPTCRGVQIQ